MIQPVTKYQTPDGNTWFSQDSAERHQIEVLMAKFATEKLKEGYSIGEIFRAVSFPVADPLLDQITKDSSLVIYHWQCRETPGYKPSSFREGMMIYVGGNAGSWSGSYGNWMGTTELLRYAANPDSILKPDPTTAREDEMDQ